MGWSEPSPHDCTSSVWDELIPIIGSAAGIEVGSLFLFFSPHFKATHKKNLFNYTSIWNPNYLPNFTTTYLHPTKNPKPRHHSNLTVVVCRK
jgi:hypothetical protein